MGGLLYHIFSSTALFSLGFYHLISATKNYNNLKSPRDYAAKPYHSFTLINGGGGGQSGGGGGGGRLKYIQLYLIISFLILAFVHEIFLSSDADPLLRGRTPVHLFTSLQTAGVIFCFLLLSVALLLAETTSSYPLPPDLFFAIASGLFFIQYSVSSSAASVQTSDLQAKCDSISARISGLSSLLSLILACHPKLFVVDVGLACSLCLQGLWVLQTGLSLYVDAFIPEGCHKLLDVVNGVEGSTKCDLEDSKLRAVAILDLVFVIHVLFVIVIVLLTYAIVAKTVGTLTRRLGSYDALPNAAILDSNHIQMKALSGTQA